MVLNTVFSFAVSLERFPEQLAEPHLTGTSSSHQSKTICGLSGNTCLQILLHSSLNLMSLDSRHGGIPLTGQYNKSAEFNMGSVLRASSGSQSQSPPVETSIRPQTVSDGFTESFDCLDRQAGPRFIERYHKNLREGIC